MAFNQTAYQNRAIRNIQNVRPSGALIFPR
jgi:hypothetical protein